MQPSATPSEEISIALLSWINDQLRDSAARQLKRHNFPIAEWVQNTVTVLAAGLFGLCVMVLQRWS